MKREKRLLIFPILLFFLLALLITCAKEYSIEGGLPAQYIVAGSPDSCAPIIISGTYTEGIPVDSTNNIQVTIDVTSKGVYNIYTETIDGISFSAKGNFTDTGRQVVTLACTGTPKSHGSFTAIIPGTNGCYFTFMVNKQIPASYVLVGDPNDCSNPVISGKYQQNLKTTVDDSVVLSVFVTAPGIFHITANTTVGFIFSDSGYFHKTGIQTITLHAAGTPYVDGPVSCNVIADSSQCNFIVLVEPGIPQAVYVLQSSLNLNIDYCTPHTIQGNYFTGVPLNSSNTVNITAYVRDTGSYSIYTGIVNGMSFVNSGHFSTTGVQTVVLAGSGTPALSGSYTFFPKIIGPTPIGGASCGFVISVN